MAAGSGLRSGLTAIVDALHQQRGKPSFSAAAQACIAQTVAKCVVGCETSVDDCHVVGEQIAGLLLSRGLEQPDSVGRQGELVIEPTLGAIEIETTRYWAETELWSGLLEHSLLDRGTKAVEWCKLPGVPDQTCKLLSLSKKAVCCGISRTLYKSHLHAAEYGSIDGHNSGIPVGEARRDYGIRPWSQTPQFVACVKNITMLITGMDQLLESVASGETGTDEITERLAQINEVLRWRFLPVQPDPLARAVARLMQRMAAWHSSRAKGAR